MVDARTHIHPKLKQYVAVKDIDPDGIKGKWKKGELIRVNPAKVQPYIASQQILPLDVALREGIYDPTKAHKKLATKVKEALVGEETTESKKATTSETKSETTSGDKKVLGNKLREAVQAKKAEQQTTNSSDTKKLDSDKLAAIKSGGKK